MHVNTVVSQVMKQIETLSVPLNDKQKAEMYTWIASKCADIAESIEADIMDEEDSEDVGE